MTVVSDKQESWVEVRNLKSNTTACEFHLFRTVTHMTSSLAYGTEVILTVAAGGTVAGTPNMDAKCAPLTTMGR